MNKKTILIILGLVVVAAGAIILIKMLVKIPVLPIGNTPPVNMSVQVQPPITKTAPVSGTKGIETWTGVLELGKGAFLKAGDKTYTLQTPAGVDLKNQGYQTNDTVNVMGKLSGGVIEVAGMNKLIK